MSVTTQITPPQHSGQKLVFADLHIHGKYSRATSENMDIASIVHYAEIKGLNLLGTGDFTHPQWRKELHDALIEAPDAQLYVSRAKPHIHFMVTTEVCTVFEYKGKTRKIHHLILCPSLEVADQISNRFSNFGELDYDGRPTLDLSAPELVELVMELSEDNAVIPAHAWTPWFSLFGSINGFDRIEDCFQDTTSYIPALETGLSSDPPMNWRLSPLDRFTFISNSDAHSPYPFRIGREANVFQLETISYNEVLNAIRKRDNSRFVFTIETDPAYGKYHWTGHRRCNVSLSPSESTRLRGICPVCHKPMTRGVDERVENLADRPLGFRPGKAVDFKHLLPLQEVIATVMGFDSETSTGVWSVYSTLVRSFGNEYNVLLNATREDLKKVADAKLVDAILKVRNDEVTVIPGYDGVYGRLDLTSSKAKTPSPSKRPFRSQSDLLNFMPRSKT